MPRLTLARAAVIAAAAAGLVYAGAYRNRWAMDDKPLVAENPAAHSVGAALDAAFEPYWPPSAGVSGGLHRPFVTLTYAVDWTISGGSPAWLHISNVLMHMAATVLVLLVACRWLPVAGAFAAALVFAVHPVHVEAVANVVGRAEILAAIWLLAAVLSARRYRAAASSLEARFWLGLTAAFVFLGLVSKEHAVIAIFVLAVDHMLDGRKPARNPVKLYVSILALTLAWFYVWRSIAAGFVDVTVAASIRSLTPVERLSTALPVLWEVIRLLTWPFDLAADYNPLVIPRRTELGFLAVSGAVIGAALLALGFASVKKAPVVAFGILIAAASYTPTSNIFFSAGVTLAERTLYLAVLAPALVVGWIVARLATPSARMGGAVAVGALCLVFGARSFMRTGFWVDSRNVVIQDLVAHPENFRAHVRVGRVFEQMGDSGRALDHYVTAGSLFEFEPFVIPLSVPLASALGRHRLAIREARRGLELEPDNPRLAGHLARAYLAAGRQDSAMVVARRAVARAPGDPAAESLYGTVLSEVDAPDWQRGISRTRVAWLSGRPVAATAEIAGLAGQLPQSIAEPDFCEEWVRIADLVQALLPGTMAEISDNMDEAGVICGWAPAIIPESPEVGN